MKIKQKVYFSNAVLIALIVLIGTFSLHDLNQILTKFRFTVIADELNASFLAMRLAEKNYLLYGDPDTLEEIEDILETSAASMDEVKADIIRAVGHDNYQQLKANLDEYQHSVEATRREATQAAGRKNRRDTLVRLRLAGRHLKEFSESITAMERERVGGIIAQSKTILLYSFLGVVFFALLFTYLIVANIGQSLRKVVELTEAIAKGNYGKEPVRILPNEMGAVIEAVNTMAGELQNREKEILQSKRLASIGILVTGVAHELNNPLNNISMIAQTYMEVYDNLEREQRIDFMQRVEEETERLRVIIKNLLDFSRPKEKHLVENEVNNVIQKTISLVQNMLNVSNIKLRLDFADNLPTVYIDEHQVQQVLVNITTNAIQAMGNTGRLTIVTRYLAGEDEVEIEIRDTGKGIEPKFMDHIFDPFFTTKEEGGTGLGLWVSYGIIRNHGGNLRVESSADVGTAFFVTLPSCKSVKECCNGKA